MLSILNNISRIKLILIIFCISLISVCSYSNYCRAQEQGGILLVIRSTDSLILDYGFSAVREDADVSTNIFETLVDLDENGDIIPKLATSWETSDGKTWIFHLRKNVKFHDGTELNADAVVVSFTRQKEDSPYYYYPGRNSSFNLYLKDIVSSIEALDSETVKIVLNYPFTPLLTYLTQPSTLIASPTALEKYKEKFVSNPVGTGPFVFKEWVKDDHITLVKNENYWGKVPNVDQLIFKVIPDASSRFLEMQKGTVCLARDLIPEQIKAINAGSFPHLKTVSRPASSIGYLGINQQKKPFDDVLVRKAINYAIDKDAIVEVIMEGLVSPAKNPLPQWMKENNTEVPGYPYDPEKAKELLEEAGYPNGFTAELWTFAFERNYMPNAPLVAQKIQSDLKKIGIDVKLSVFESAIYWELVNTLRHQLMLGGWNTPPTPDFLIRISILTQGQTGYGESPQGQELMKKAIKASETLDEEERIRLYKEIQQTIYEDAPNVPICHPNNIWAYNAKIHNLEISAEGQLWNVNDVWIEK